MQLSNESFQKSFDLFQQWYMNVAETVAYSVLLSDWLVAVTCRTPPVFSSAYEIVMIAE
jgi:hypothetical protein